jgi:hypothetical protein
MRIIIDTNSKLTSGVFVFHGTHVYLSSDSSDPQVLLHVHETLQHPFQLAWKHRQHVLSLRNKFDVFMYIEDDMLIPYLNYVNYLTTFNLLYPDFVPGFARVEMDSQGFMYNTDNQKPCKYSKSMVVSKENKIFIQLDNPYHAFWIAPRHLILRETVRSFYDNSSISREDAASRLPWSANNRILVELTGEYEVSKLCFAYHLTNKYVNDVNSLFGKILMSELIVVSDT